MTQPHTAHGAPKEKKTSSSRFQPYFTLRKTCDLQWRVSKKKGGPTWSVMQTHGPCSFLSISLVRSNQGPLRRSSCVIIASCVDLFLWAFRPFVCPSVPSSFHAPLVLREVLGPFPQRPRSLFVVGHRLESRTSSTTG